MLTVFTQEQPDYIGLKVEDPFMLDNPVIEMHGSAEVVVARVRHASGFAELFPFRARAGGTSHVEKVPRHCQLMD